MSSISSSSNAIPSSSSPPYAASCSLIFVVSGSSPYCFKFRAYESIRRQPRRPRSITGPITHLFYCVLDNNIRLVILEFTQGDQDDVTLVDPHLLPHLSSNVGKTLFTVETLGFESTVAEHLCDLGVFYGGIVSVTER